MAAKEQIPLLIGLVPLILLAQTTSSTKTLDPQESYRKAVENVHPKAAPSGEDVAAPTTLLIDGRGVVRWMFRPDRAIERLSPAEVLAAVDTQF